MPPETNAKRRRRRRSGPAPGSAYLAAPAVAGVEGRSARRRRKNRESKARKGDVEAGIRPAPARLLPPIVNETADEPDEPDEAEAPGWRRVLTGGDEGGVAREGLGEQGDRISPSRPLVRPRTPAEEASPRPEPSPVAPALTSTPTPQAQPDAVAPVELEQLAGPSTSPNDTKGKARAVDFDLDITETLADAEIPARASGSRSRSPNVVIVDTGIATPARSRSRSRSGSPPSPHTRAVEGWTTRRTDRHAEIEEALEILGRGSVEGLPADTLLHSLHAHASRFYTSHGLLLDPSQTRHGPRANLPWRDRKRALLEDAGVLPISASRGPEGSGSRDPGARGGRGRVGSGSERGSRSRSRGLPATAVGGHDDGAGEAESDGGSDDNRRRTRSMSLRRISAPRWKTRATESASRSPVKASEADELDSEHDDDKDDGMDVPILADAQLGYRRRDMHTAFDGQALLALGVLVEELVAHELEQAGYAPGHEKGTKRKRKRMSTAGEGERDGSPRPMASRC